MYPEMAPAGLDDADRSDEWAIAITDARAGSSTTLLSQGMAAKMLTPEKTRIGLGPFVGGTGRNFHLATAARRGLPLGLVMYPELASAPPS